MPQANPALSYISTRQKPGVNDSLSFEQVLLGGLAPDGGLYVPLAVPRFTADEIRALAGLDYPRLTAAIMAPLVGEFLPLPALERLAVDAYAGFDHRAVAPLKQLAQGEWLLELFHGPTLAFKDYALQVLGRLFDAALARQGRRATIVGATSGDTGSAAIEACRGRDRLDIFILYPHGRVSEVQRRQMTCVDAPNIHTIAVEGNFDDCQDLVKALFADTSFRTDYGLAAVNSINWARILAQTAYYFAAALALGAPDRAVSFTVPTGNFGNIYAGHLARSMGLPIEQLVIGTNRNDILARYIETGVMAIEAVQPSLSPSMDIQVSSNFERLLFEVCGRDGTEAARMMAGFRTTGRLDAGHDAWQTMRRLLRAHRVDDEAILSMIAEIDRETGELIDPHTAIAVAAMRQVGGRPGLPRIAVATAHPAKFPDAVTRATGRIPALPPFLRDLMTQPERTHILPKDLDTIRRFIATRARAA